MISIRFLVSFTLILATSFAISYTQQFSESTIELMNMIENMADWGDFDNDSDLDLIISGYTDDAEDHKLYINKNGVFIGDSLSPFIGLWQSDGGWFDYNNDDYLDFIITGWTNNDGASHAILYKNNMNNFIPTTDPWVDVHDSSIDYGDFDNDGDLDLIISGCYDISNDYRATFIYENKKNEGFERLDIPIVAISKGVVRWFDYDNDGYLDFLVAGARSAFTGISRIYRNLGNKEFIPLDMISLPDNSRMDVALADINSDGRMDIFFTGNNSVRLLKNINDSTFSYSDQLEGGSWSKIAVGDMDNDGDYDVIIGKDMGDNDSLTYYINDSIEFIKAAHDILPTLNQGEVELADYDNDSDLDVLISGWDEHTFNHHSILYTNNILANNSAPDAPSNLTTTVNFDTVFFSWDTADDDHTAKASLTYNIRVGTSTESGNIVNPMASNTGYRKIVRHGNVEHKTFFILRDLPKNQYYWSVQAIDASYAGGTWAEEATFEITDSYDSVTESTTISVDNPSYMGGNLTVYPNPSHGLFNIAIKILQKESIKLRVFNIQGEQILMEELKQEIGIISKQLDLSKYMAGIYFLQIVSSDKILTKKIVIEH